MTATTILTDRPNCLACPPGHPADLIVWGKLAAPAALGPHCAEHTDEHLGRRASARADQLAAYDLRAAPPVPQYCRQCRDELPHGSVCPPAVVVIAGRDCPPGALGPKCAAHARQWLPDGNGGSGAFWLTVQRDEGTVSAAAVSAAVTALLPHIVDSVLAELRAREGTPDA